METTTRSSARDTVLALVEALNNEDFKTARGYAADEMSFLGVLGSREGADAYFHDMERMRLKYDIKKVFENGDDVCLLYDLYLSGVTIFGCGWYQVKEGKVTSLRVVFDPRPVLEASG